MRGDKAKCEALARSFGARLTWDEGRHLELVVEAPDGSVWSGGEHHIVVGEYAGFRGARARLWTAMAERLAGEALEPDPEYDPSDAGEWYVWQRESEGDAEMMARPFILVSRRTGAEHPQHEAWADEDDAQGAADAYNHQSTI